MSLGNVDAKAQPPYCDKHEDDPTADVGEERVQAYVPLDDQSHNWEQERQTPKGIDVGVVFLVLAPEEEQEIAAKNNDNGQPKVTSVNRTLRSWLAAPQDDRGVSHLRNLL